MQIVLLRSGCGNGRTCPNINRSDRGTYVIQGYIAEAPAGGVAVDVPAPLLPELAATERDGLRHTPHGMIRISGVQLADQQALRELDLPAGENAIEVPIAALPELSDLAAPC